SSGARSGKTRNPFGEILSSTSLQIDNLCHPVFEVLDGDWGSAMMLPPSREEFSKLLTAGIIGLELLDTLNGVLAAQGKKRIAAPLRPNFIASKRLAALEFCRVMPGPKPDCQNRCKQLRTAMLDLLKEAARERARFRVLATRIEFTRYKATSE